MKKAVFVIAVFAAASALAQKPAGVPMLSSYDLSNSSVRVVKLPHRLSEASGIVMTDDGRLLCHDDENGVVYQVNTASGEIVKSFSLGRLGVKEDFEDIAVKGKRVFLVASNGVIFEFPEAESGRTVEFRTYKTFLTAKNDVEGLCYDAATDCLLLLCKESPGKSYHGNRAVYEFSLKTKSLALTPRFLIQLEQITKTSDDHEFRPSGIAKHPKTGSYFVIAAHGSTIVELSPDGKILAQQSINNKTNPHPEGIAFAPDLTLLLCNDGQGKRGTLSFYPATK